MDKMGIQHKFSSPYHPQCNGLVENTNGQIIKMLTKYVYDCPERSMGVQLGEVLMGLHDLLQGGHAFYSL